MHLLRKKELEFEDLENSQPVHIAKKEKAYSEENPKGVAEQPLDKISLNVNPRSNHPSQKKLGTDVGLDLRRLCQLGLKETEP